MARRMRFEIRKDIHDTVDLLQRMQSKQWSDSYALGYMKAVIVDLVMDLPPRARTRQINLLTSALNDEIKRQEEAA